MKNWRGHFSEVHEVRRARERAAESRTAWGRVKNAAGWVMSAVCAYRLVTGGGGWCKVKLDRSTLP